MTDKRRTRADLRDSLLFTELTYVGVDPRRLFRKLTKAIEEVETIESFKYSVEEWTDDQRDLNPEIRPEPIGTQTGRVIGGVTVRTTGWQEFSAETETESSNGPLFAAITAVIGVLAIFAGLSFQGSARAAAVAIGVFLLLGAGAIYYFSSPSTKERTHYYQKRSDILLIGEASAVEYNGENLEPTDGATRYGIEAADLNVYIGETIDIRRETEEGQRTLDLEDLSGSKQQELAETLTPLPEELPEIDQTEKVMVERRVS